MLAAGLKRFGWTTWATVPPIVKLLQARSIVFKGGQAHPNILTTKKKIKVTSEIHENPNPWGMGIA